MPCQSSFDEEALHRCINANVAKRNVKHQSINWHFTIRDAHRKLPRPASDLEHTARRSLDHGSEHLIGRDGALGIPRAA